MMYVVGGDSNEDGIGEGDDINDRNCTILFPTN